MKVNNGMLANFLDVHDVPVMVTIRQPLIAYLNLGKEETTGLNTGSTGGSHTDGEKGAEDSTVNLPCSETGSHAPNMLENLSDIT